ncbi:MAG: T9SS type A sorting domain-containing protein [Bacteroidetes bacterium]|nr:T9SS type A sorting domain-containing protein [Bacteroidota bacterium]MBP6401805.1 T9SS type A sorting domain-containing protein [Bacteroidia bacterium]MBP6648010.1 T9SS type A sorting domain-containing protein [Bacteroidia bacterium]
MKKLLLLSCLSFSMSICAQSLDGNGQHRSNDNVEPSAFETLRNANMLNTISWNSVVYDTLRPLDELNDNLAADAYPWLSPDALRLYFTYGGGSSNQIMQSERITTSNYFSGPVPVTLPVSILSIWLSNDELDFYGSDGNDLFYGHRNSSASAFTSFSTITLNGFSTSFFSGPSLDQTQNELYLYLVGTTNVIAQMTRTGATSFDLVRFLPFPPNTTPSPGQLSKDGLSYFVPARTGVASSSLYEFTRASLTDSFTVNNFNPVQGIPSSTNWKTQPTVSDNGTFLVFTASQTNSWMENDLFIAEGDEFVSVFDPSESFEVSVSPNPSSGIFQVRSGSSLNSTIELLNVLGESIYKNDHLHPGEVLTIDLGGNQKGVVFCKIVSGSGKQKLVKLVIE